MVNESDCVIRFFMNLECEVKLAKNCEKTTEILLDECSTCSTSVGDSKLAKKIQAQVRYKHKLFNCSTSMVDSNLAKKMQTHVSYRHK